MGMPPGMPPGDPSQASAASGMLPVILGALANKAGANPAGGAGAQLSQQQASLQGADPGMILRQLEQVNQVLGVLFVKTFQSLPNVANQVSATMKQMSRAIKEAQQASTTMEAVGGADQDQQPKPPIDFSAAMTGQNAAPDQGPMQSTGM
jgi:hypothetical protein